MTDTAGRACPIAYRYGAAAIANAPLRHAETLYVVGGLYGNPSALDTVEGMARVETSPVTICFNGDFNWFNIDDATFKSINERVLKHDAIRGNVEFEFARPGEDADCGCAYPEAVDAGTVARSNRIHATLKATARKHPDLVAKLSALSLFARYQVGTAIVSVVHGDADSLAGWSFDPSELDKPENEEKIADAFRRARTNIFASTHTCMPALRQFDQGIIVNNGAAGMPNFRHTQSGLLTRISTQLSPHVPVYGVSASDVYIDALAINYDQTHWQQQFLANWPSESDAYVSYFDRMVNGLWVEARQATGSSVVKAS